MGFYSPNIIHQQKVEVMRNHTLGTLPTSASYIGISFLLTIIKHAVLAILH